MADSNHRTRVAAERRERMRARLLDSAIALVAARGPAAVTIDDVVAGAAASRGTFYKYFDTPASLLQALGAQASAELIQLIDPVLQAHSDPAVRLGLGLRTVLQLVAAYPAIGAVIARAGWPAQAGIPAYFQPVLQDLTLGRQLGRFAALHEEVAAQLVAGTTVGALHALAGGRLPVACIDQVCTAVLQGLGLDSAETRRIVALPVAVPDLPTESLLGRFVGVNAVFAAPRQAALAAPRPA